MATENVIVNDTLGVGLLLGVGQVYPMMYEYAPAYRRSQVLFSRVNTMKKLHFIHWNRIDS